MKHPVKKIISHLLMFALVLCVAIAPSLAESKPDCLQTISGENGTTYSNLFDVILSDDYNSVWEEHCKAIVGEENAAEANPSSVATCMATTRWRCTATARRASSSTAGI